MRIQRLLLTNFRRSSSRGTQERGEGGGLSGTRNLGRPERLKRKRGATGEERNRHRNTAVLLLLARPSLSWSLHWLFSTAPLVYLTLAYCSRFDKRPEGGRREWVFSQFSQSEYRGSGNISLARRTHSRLRNGHGDENYAVSTDLSHRLDQGGHDVDADARVKADGASAEQARRHLRLNLVRERKTSIIARGCLEALNT